MLRYIFKRIVILLPVLMGISLLASLLYYVIPGDMVRVMLGQHVDPLTYANVRRALGLDVPLWQNYTGFLRGIFKGDLGYSFIQQRPVAGIIAEALPVTVKLTCLALAIIIAFGIPAGVISAVRNDKVLGRTVNIGAILGISVPSFLLGLFSQLIFGVKLGLLPVSGTAHRGLGYILPSFAVGLPLAALYARLTRASVQEILTKDYILFTIGRGIPAGRVILHHALRNALIPVITQVGMQFSLLITGSVLTETIFNLPGMGRLVYEAINMRDFPLLRGILLLFALTLVLVNLLVDIFYIKLDPRIAQQIVRENCDATCQNC